MVATPAPLGADDQRVHGRCLGPAEEREAETNRGEQPPRMDVQVVDHQSPAAGTHEPKETGQQRRHHAAGASRVYIAVNVAVRLAAPGAG